VTIVKAEPSEFFIRIFPGGTTKSLDQSQWNFMHDNSEPRPAPTAEGRKERIVVGKIRSADCYVIAGALSSNRSLQSND
jgi:hypothetical protein